MTYLSKIVAVALVCYFAFVLCRAIDKLMSREIGTMFATKSEETVQGCSISIRVEHIFFNYIHLALLVPTNDCMHIQGSI